MAVHLFAMIANALGASILKDGSDQTTAFSKAIAEFVAAGHQAIEVQKRRPPD